jgi:hypothetical protein
MRLADYIGKYWAGAEVIYAVIIAMTFTSVLRSFIFDAEKAVNTVVYSALFCCIAWGIADGAFYAWERNYIFRRENEIVAISKFPEKSESAVAMIRDELDDTILRNINEENRLGLYQKLVQYLSEFGSKQELSTRDAISIVAATFISSMVAAVLVTLPFFLIDDLRNALNISNLVCIILLFIAGYSRALDRSLNARLTSAIGTSFIGVIIAVVTIRLGG